MTIFLINNLSEERWFTYEKLSETNGLSAEDLYQRNLLYSKELYVILAGLEVVLRNKFHDSLTKQHQSADWLSLCLKNNIFLKHHKRQIDDAIRKLTRNKQKDYTIPDLISELSFGFWVHLTNSPYEKKFWVPSLSKCFPNKLGPPIREDTLSRLKELLKLRNKIAHLEPIVKNEYQLIQAYQNAYDLMSWICPDTANWFDKVSNFRNVWNNYNKKES